MRALERALVEQDAIVSQNADRIPTDMGEAANQRGAIKLLEFIERGAVYNACDNVTHVEEHPQVGRDNAVDLFRRIERIARRAEFEPGLTDPIEAGDNALRNGDGMRVIIGKIISHARLPAVHVRAAKLLGGHGLAGGRLYQRRAAEKNRT